MLSAGCAPPESEVIVEVSLAHPYNADTESEFIVEVSLAHVSRTKVISGQIQVCVCLLLQYILQSCSRVLFLFITAVPNTKLRLCVGGGTREELGWRPVFPGSSRLYVWTLGK